MSNDPATDRSNLHDLQKGDTSALNRLIARWQRPLLSFSFRYVQNSSDAQDLVAETFVRLYQRRMQLRHDTNLSAWLFTTLTNLCHNHHRWKRRHPSVAFGPGEGSESASPANEPASAEPGPDSALIRDESLDALKLAIDALPHDLKVSVLLHHYEHLSYREIAAITRCSERGVETRLYRARAQLRTELSRHFQESPSLGQP
ncbi:MAG TPA: sigma-70 family RNA polymerase sigma factor [Opitutaceae bacterium]|nr:sigma-70 family RNA polymerase sigma factor [Opitutaceae bacterium]